MAFVRWTMDAVEGATDPRSLERGLAYARQERVGPLKIAGDTVTADVYGTETYTVTLSDQGWDCDCPVGDSGAFCKHCVAVAVVASDRAAEDGVADGMPMPDVDGWLDSRPRAELVELVGDAARRSPELTRSLTVAAARAVGDVGELRRAVDSTLRTRRFLDWQDSSAFAADARPVLDELHRAVQAGRARDTVPLIQRGIGHVVTVLERADDSNGSIGDVMCELLDLHATACALGRPDPLELASWLLKFGLDEQDWFTADVDAYADALGETGIAAYRTEVERRVRANDDSFAVKRARERLAIVDRDVATLVTLLGEDLSQPYQFLRVAAAMAELDRQDDVLAWAERGIAATTTGWQVAQLFDIAVGERVRRGELEAAVGLRRVQLTRMPDLASYQALRVVCVAHGCWGGERDAGRTLVAQRSPRDYVEALLDDGDAGEAWTTAMASSDGTIGDELWLRLARVREKAHPADVLPTYRRVIEATLQRADRRNYQTAVGLMKRLRRASAGAGDDGFPAYVASLREHHRRRPTFIAMLDRDFA